MRSIATDKSFYHIAYRIYAMTEKWENDNDLTYILPVFVMNHHFHLLGDDINDQF